MVSGKKAATSSSTADEEGDASSSPTLTSFVDLCTELNMDKETRDRAWASFEAIRVNYTLEAGKKNAHLIALF